MPSPEHPPVVQGTHVTPLLPALCCSPGCNRLADWEINYGPEVDDFTEACVEHVGDLLEPDKENRLYPMAHDLARGLVDG